MILRHQWSHISSVQFVLWFYVYPLTGLPIDNLRCLWRLSRTTNLKAALTKTDLLYSGVHFVFSFFFHTPIKQAFTKASVVLPRLFWCPVCLSLSRSEFSQKSWHVTKTDPNLLAFLSWARNEKISLWTPPDIFIYLISPLAVETVTSSSNAHFPQRWNIKLSFCFLFFWSFTHSSGQISLGYSVLGLVCLSSNLALTLT